jgi:hypothetical protein
MFNRKITQRLNIEVTEAKAFRIFIRANYLLKNEQLSANNKVTPPTRK